MIVPFLEKIFLSRVLKFCGKKGGQPRGPEKYHQELLKLLRRRLFQLDSLDLMVCMWSHFLPIFDSWVLITNYLELASPKPNVPFDVHLIPVISSVD